MELKEIKELVYRLDDLKTQKQTLNEQLSEINEELVKTEVAISEALTENGLESFKSDIGTAYKVVHPSITVEDKQTFHKWLKQQGAFEDIVSVNASTLKAFVKSQTQEGEDFPNIPGLTISSYVKLNFRRS